MALTYSDFGVKPDPSFNLEAANAIYDVIMKMDDDEALAFARILAFEGITSDIETNKVEIQKFVDGFFKKQSEVIRKRLASAYVSKRVSGEDTDSLIAAAEAIRKAVGDYTTEERRQNVSRQLRGAGGRWITMNRKVQYGTPDRLLKPSQTQRLNVPSKMKREGDQKNYQEAYLQLQSFLRDELAGMPAGDSIVELTYTVPQRGPKGQVLDKPETVTTDKLIASAKTEDLLDANKFKDGGKLTDITVRTATDLNVEGAAFGLTSALAGPRAASYVGTKNGEAVGESLRSFADEWTRQGEAGTNEQMYRRLQSGSEFAQVLAPTKAYKLQAALKAGAWVGQYGPEAEKVVGPTARKTAYRYRGIERAPDKDLVRIVENTPREAVIGPTTKEVVTRGGGLKRVDEESPIVQYFTSRLPKEELYTLQRKSGTIPPSEGIIIDKQGRVTTQAVGYGDDWYLPFNLRNVGKLNGGEYIRTRAIGGLTTEDIYTGLVSGARRVTVVSRSGVFTMEFDETFRGNRRYSDKAARMVSRYGQLLDAIDKGNITPGVIPDDRMAELRAEAISFAGEDDRRALTAQLDKLREREMDNPQLSVARKQAIKLETIQDAAAKMQTADGMTMSAGDYIRNAKVKRAIQVKTQMPAIPDEELKTYVDREFASEDQTLTNLGLAEEANDRIASEQARYAASMRPLRLDGNGYNYAAQALREQFPYYIKNNIRYRPTPDIMGVAQGTGQRDYGYVKPRFNRPAGALAGYFDTSITGTGKVTADQTNYQNYGVRRRTGVAQEATATPSETTTTTVTQTAPAKRSMAEDANALIALKNELRSKTATRGGQPFTPEQLAGQFPVLGQMGDDQLRAALTTDPELRGKVEQEIRNARNYFDLDENVVDAYLNPGAPSKKPVAWDVDIALTNPNTEFEFEGYGYAMNRKAEDYDKFFMETAAFKDLRNSLNIDVLNDPVSELVLDEYIANRRDLWIQDKRWREARMKPGPKPIQSEAVFEGQVKNAIKLKTLMRRYKQAQANAAQSAVSTQDIMPVITETQNQIMLISPSETQQFGLPSVPLSPDWQQKIKEMFNQ